MESGTIRQLLLAHFSDATLEVAVEGSHVNLSICSQAFAGLNTLKRQQAVYSVLAEHIASGAIHAVQMKTYTPDEEVS